MSEKDAYVKKLEARIDEWNAEISKLAAKSRNLEADAALTYHKEIDGLRRRQQDVREELLKLRESSDGAWEDVKAGVQRSYEEMENAIKSAIKRF